MCIYGPEFLKFQDLRHHFFGKTDKIFKWLLLLESMNLLKHWGVRRMAKSLLLPTETFSKEMVVLKLPIKTQFMQKGNTTSILQHPVLETIVGKMQKMLAGFFQGTYFLFIVQISGIICSLIRPCDGIEFENFLKAKSLSAFISVAIGLARTQSQKKILSMWKICICLSLIQ